MKKWRVRVKIIPYGFSPYCFEESINGFLDSNPNAVVNDIRIHSSSQMPCIAVITYKELYEEEEE